MSAKKLTKKQTAEYLKIVDASVKLQGRIEKLYKTTNEMDYAPNHGAIANHAFRLSFLLITDKNNMNL